MGRGGFICGVVPYADSLLFACIQPLRVDPGAGMAAIATPGLLQEILLWEDEEAKKDFEDLVNLVQRAKTIEEMLGIFKWRMQLVPGVVAWDLLGSTFCGSVVARLVFRSPFY